MHIKNILCLTQLFLHLGVEMKFQVLHNKSNTKGGIVEIYQ